MSRISSEAGEGYEDPVDVWWRGNRDWITRGGSHGVFSRLARGFGKIFLAILAAGAVWMLTLMAVHAIRYGSVQDRNFFGLMTITAAVSISALLQRDGSG